MVILGLELLCCNTTLPKITAVAANRPAVASFVAVAPAGRSAASYTTTGDTTEPCHRPHGRAETTGPGSVSFLRNYICFDLVPKSLQRIVLELIKPASQCAETFPIDFVDVFLSLSVFAYQASFLEDLEMV